MIFKIIKRFKNAFVGLFHALKHDQSFAINVYSGTFVVALVIYFFQPLTPTEILFLALSGTLILVTEMQNSAFETALDTIHPKMHREIGRSKDMASASVLLAGFFGLFVVLVIALT